MRAGVKGMPMMIDVVLMLCIGEQLHKWRWQLEARTKFGNKGGSVGISGNTERLST
jgi:hypothetical protein